MIRADEHMPDFTPEELEEMERREAEYYADAEAAYDDERAAERNPHADPKCSYCHGTGIVTDWVDYGSTVVPMDSVCDCVEDDADVDAD